MVCGKCGASLGENAKFCDQCGAKVEAEKPPIRHCTFCGAKLADHVLFCQECGHRIEDRTEDSTNDSTDDQTKDQIKDETKDQKKRGYYKLKGKPIKVGSSVMSLLVGVVFEAVLYSWILSCIDPYSYMEDTLPIYIIGGVGVWLFGCLMIGIAKNYEVQAQKCVDYSEGYRLESHSMSMMAGGIILPLLSLCLVFVFCVFYVFSGAF